MGHIKACRMCKGARIEKFLDLGRHTLMNSLLRKDQLQLREEHYPLQVGFCQRCRLVQLLYVVDSRKIYQDVDYLYFSSDMPNLSDYFRDYAQEIGQRYLSEGGLMVEIGSNDGVLLSLFKPPVRVLGVDPSTNVVLRALKKGIPTVSAFFSADVARKIRNEWGQAQVISGSNCIAHLENLHDLMDGVSTLLAEDGVFCIEANYWGGMVRNTNYSLIYLDHFSFFSLEVWQTFAKKWDMSVFDAYVTPAQGGSLRVCLSKDRREPTGRLKALEGQEREKKTNSFKTCQSYAQAVNRRRKEIRELLRGLSRQGKVVAGYGAAAKGLSILKCSEIGKDAIRFFVDDSPAKQGYFTPETHIPIYRRDQVQDPDYFMVLAPNYAEVIIGKEQEFIRKGGKFIIPKERVEVYPN